MPSRTTYLRRNRFTRRTALFSSVVLFCLVTLIVSSIGQPTSVQAQSGDGLWGEPVNLSTSGSMSLLVSAGDPNGRAQAMWWDKFDGATYTFLKPDGTWAKPTLVPGIYGQRVRGQAGRVETTPPLEMRLLTNANNQAFAFWRLSTGDLMVARTDTRNPKWASGTRLITNPLIWSVYVAPDNSLNLVYILATTIGRTQPGIYFRQSKDGARWTEPVAITTSLYFRTLAVGNANLSVIADGTGQVLVGWDDPQTQQSYQARSLTNGSKFEAPEAIEAGGIAEVSIPKRIRYIKPPDASFLRLWEAGDSCVVYQQTLNPDNTWTAPLRVLEQITNCFRSSFTYLAEDGRLYMTIGATPNSQSIIVVWDGTTWSYPLTPRVTFINSDTNDLVALDCENLVLAQNKFIILGCDQHGDAWALTSQVLVSDFLPQVGQEWFPPVILSHNNTDASFPNVGVDQEGRFHVTWSQAATLGASGETLMYTRGDGFVWADPAAVVKSELGAIAHPAILADPNQVLHLVWNEGPTGQVKYNQSFIRDALIASDWGDTLSLPAARSAGESPKIVLGPSGKLYVIYAIPFNEDRGLYFTSSNDLGLTWSPSTRIFDAAALNWGVVHEIQLVVDGQDKLHVAWSRAASPDQASPQGIYYTHSLDGGVTWSEALEITADVDSEPRLAMSSGNILHLLWAHKTLNGYELLHQWSPDSGQTWSVSARVPDLGVVAPATGLVAGANGSLYVTGMELTRESSAALFYLHWNGQNWVDRDSVRLGYDFHDGMEVTSAILPSGRLGVFYRVLAPTTTDNLLYVIGYTGRQLLSGTDVVIIPTFTPRPLPTSLPAATVEATLIPTGDLNLTTEPPNSTNQVWLQIGAVVIVMIVISVIAILRLSSRVGR